MDEAKKRSRKKAEKIEILGGKDKVIDVKREIAENDLVENKSGEKVEIGRMEKIGDKSEKEIRVEAEKEVNSNESVDINKEISSGNKNIEEIQNKQIKWTLFLMFATIILILAIFFVKSNFVDKFNYKGLIFQKTQLGDIRFYSTRFPIVGITGQVIGDYAVNLRNDPRKLEYIPVNTTNGKIEFALDKGKYGEVYITLNPFMEVCEDTGISLLELSGFLRDSGLDVRSAVTDKAYAKSNNLTQRWCYDSGFDTVIIYTDGNKTTINEIAPNCYEVVFKECEVLQVSERIIAVILEDYANRFENA